MIRMGEELDRRLDEAKYDMYYALIALDQYLSASYPGNMKLKQIAADKLISALAKVEGNESSCREHWLSTILGEKILEGA